MRTSMHGVCHTDKPSRIIELCPICKRERKLRYSLKKETMYRMFNIQYGIDVLERKDSMLYAYVPCNEHIAEFKKKVDEYVRKYEKVKNKYRQEIRNEIERIRRNLLEKAGIKLSKIIEAMNNNDGIIFWVCEGRHDELDVIKEISVVVIKQGNTAKMIYGSRRPVVAYKRNSLYASTHYFTQDVLMALDKYNVKWKAYVQGLIIENKEDIDKFFNAIFFKTHYKPNWTLIDFLANMYSIHSLYSDGFRNIIHKANKMGEEWYLVSTKKIEERIAEKLFKKYGINPRKYPHIKDCFTI